MGLSEPSGIVSAQSMCVTMGLSLVPIRPTIVRFRQESNEHSSDLIVCFTCYIVFSIAVLAHSPVVVYYHC